MQLDQRRYALLVAFLAPPEPLGREHLYRRLGPRGVFDRSIDGHDSPPSPQTEHDPGAPQMIQTERRRICVCPAGRRFRSLKGSVEALRPYPRLPCTMLTVPSEAFPEVGWN
jgi:hypothetical protein